MAVDGDLGMKSKEDGIGDFFALNNALCQSSQLVCKGLRPSLLVCWTFDEVEILHGSTGQRIDDSVCGMVDCRNVAGSSKFLCVMELSGWILVSRRGWCRHHPWRCFRVGKRWCDRGKHSWSCPSGVVLGVLKQFGKFFDGVQLIMGDMRERSGGGWIFANLLDCFNGLDDHIGRGLIRYCGLLWKKSTVSTILSALVFFVYTL